MLILDADGLIKLHRAGVLELLARHYECTIPSAVYQEAVVNAGDKYPDSQQIDRIIQVSMKVAQSPLDYWSYWEDIPINIGAGERQALTLFMGSTSIEPTTIISDDAAFLRLLATHSIPFLSPIDMILTMVKQGVLTQEMAKVALNLVKPMTNPDEYQRAIACLEER